MVIDVRFLQSSKVYLPIDLMFDVIFTVFKLIHPLNVQSLIEVTPDGIVMDVNDSHPEKAKDPIDVTEDGIVIDVRFLQFSKALFPIDVILEVIFTVFKLIHSLNVPLSIEVTPDGIVMDINDSHPENA